MRESKNENEIVLFDKKICVIILYMVKNSLNKRGVWDGY